MVVMNVGDHEFTGLPQRVLVHELTDYFERMELAK
jgi:hypothetical protein